MAVYRLSLIFAHTAQVNLWPVRIMFVSHVARHCCPALLLKGQIGGAVRPACKFLLSIVLCIAVVLGSGCASTATGKKQSVYQPQQNLQLNDGGRSQADANVVIRYPAIVDRNAETVFFDAFAAHPIGGSIKETDSNSDRVAEAMVAKSNYYVMSLYRELQAALPDNSVLLSPHYVFIDEQGQLSSKPLLAAEKIPSVLTIDFATYSFPDTSKMMDAPPLTFGDLVTPLFVLHSNHWLSPPTHGLLLSSEPLLGTAWEQSARQAEAQFASRLSMQPVDYQRPLDFISYLAKGSPASLDLPLKAAGSVRQSVTAVERYPLEKIRMQSELVASLDKDSSIDPFAEDFVKGAAARVVTALNDINHDRATFFARQSALASFDPDLANAFLMRSADESVQARVQLAESLLVAERKFLARQSQAIYDGTYAGAYGDEMRRMIAAEYRMLEERRDLARKQNIGTALAIVAMAGAVYAGSQAGDSGSWGEYNNWQFLTSALALSSVWAVNVAMNKNAESKTVGENFLMQMAPALNQQSSVQVELLESNEEITARNFDEFKSQTIALYQKYARSMTVDGSSQCQFRHPSAGQSGSWYGACNSGFAEGLGYGLVRGDNGTEIEYLGNASQGLAEGLGAMIMRSPASIGAIYYEGQFERGQPHGIVRLEQPGRKTETREFIHGKDAGVADEQQLSPLGFN